MLHPRSALLLLAPLAIGSAACADLTSPSDIRVTKEERAAPAKPRMADAPVGDPVGANGRAVPLKPPHPSACAGH